MRIVLIVVAALFGSALLVVAGSFALWLGADLIPQRIQPHAELTLKLDSSAGPALAARALFPAVRDGLREPRVGFATIAASGDSIEVTVGDGVDRAQAQSRLRELSHQSGAEHVDAEQFSIT